MKKSLNVLFFVPVLVICSCGQKPLNEKKTNEIINSITTKQQEENFFNKTFSSTQIGKYTIVSDGLKRIEETENVFEINVENTFAHSFYKETITYDGTVDININETWMFLRENKLVLALAENSDKRYLEFTNSDVAYNDIINSYKSNASGYLRYVEDNSVDTDFDNINVKNYSKGEGQLTVKGQLQIKEEYKTLKTVKGSFMFEYDDYQLVSFQEKEEIYFIETQEEVINEASLINKIGECNLEYPDLTNFQKR